MPELPEVSTTVQGLQKVLPSRRIIDVWTDYNSPFHYGKQNIKDPDYFDEFREKIVGKLIVSVNRRGKYVLISLEKNLTLVIHLKMTGLLLYGDFEHTLKGWRAAETERPSLREIPSSFIHLVFALDNGASLVFADMRKFGTVTLINTDEIDAHPLATNLGPDPTSADFTKEVLKERLMSRPKGFIKPTLLDQSIVAGIGNYMADEILWAVGVHPESIIEKLPNSVFPQLHFELLDLINRALNQGGYSGPNYRNIYGERGSFVTQHHAYGREGDGCDMETCEGVIVRKVIRGRSAHFCDTHQILYF